MRRFLAIFLMLLLPLQSVWALMATPCAGLMYVPQATVSAAMADGGDHHAGHPQEATSAHDHQHADVPQTPSNENCGGSAACMSLHAPPLAHAHSTELATVRLPALIVVSGMQAFTSAPQLPLHRPPIGPHA